jgi:hypothetical protein
MDRMNFDPTSATLRNLASSWIARSAGTCHSSLFMMNFKSETAIILTTGTVVEATELESLKRNTTADGEIGLMTLPTRRSSKQHEPTLTTYGRSCAGQTHRYSELLEHIHFFENLFRNRPKDMDSRSSRSLSRT